MIAEITSFTSTEKYGLTINEQTSEVEECKCKRFYFSGRKHTCKHSQAFDQEVQKAARFILAQNKVREIEETARCYRELAFAS